MNDKELRHVIKRAVTELGIDKPIMSTKVVGGRIELHLYGGESIILKAVSEQEHRIDYSPMTVAQLRKTAAESGLAIPKKIKKAELIDLLEKNANQPG